ncbi:MAG TPA: ABC transporter permease [Bryobacteraceae bacterium]|nr:ABC transporter permease [Bryobacteraceae bacterium]
MMRLLVKHLIRLFPADFRDSYGADMLATFEDRWRERPGPRTAARILIDLVQSVWLERRGNSKGDRSMRTVWQDARFALRTLRKSPGFATIVIVTLALGIGVNTAMFSVANRVLWASLPFAQPDRLVSVDEVEPQDPDAVWGATYPSFREWQAQTGSLESMSAVSWTNRVLREGSEPVRVRGASVSHEFFPLLGVQPELGRVFTPDDDKTGASAVIVLSHEMWTTRFGADPAILGRTVHFDGVAPTVVGVMPATFRYPPRTEYWLPMAAVTSPSLTARWDFWMLSTIGRLKPGRTGQDVASEVSGIMARVLQAHPEARRGHIIRVRPLRDDLGSDLRPALLILMGGVGLVLLIACGNVASLMLVRATARTRELVIRAALGAGRRRLVRQLFTEGAMLALCGGIAGVGLAVLTTRWLPLLSRDWRLANVPIDASVLLFALIATAFTCLLFGVLPAMRATRVETGDALRSGARGSQSRQRAAAQQVLVTAEVALCVVLLVASALLLQSWRRVLHVDPGFRADGLAILRVNLPPTYKDDASIQGFYSRATTQIAGLPGVTGVTLTTSLPISGGDGTGDLTIEGNPAAPGELGAVTTRSTTPDYFNVMGIPLVRGRTFGEHDDASRQPVAIINQAMMRRFWPHQDPVGKRIKIGTRNLADWMTIVGVVKDVRNDGLSSDIGYSAYLPFAQGPDRGMELAVRTPGNPQGLLPTITAQLRRMEPALLIDRAQTMQARIDESVAPRRLNLVVLGLFAGLALLLSAVGLYGVVAFAVRQRTQEFGIRMALGATSGNVALLVLRQGLGLAAAGLTLGIPAAIAASRLLSSLLFGVTTTNPAVLASVALLLTAVTLAACWIPAWRATQIRPTEALRAE